MKKIAVNHRRKAKRLIWQNLHYGLSDCTSILQRVDVATAVAQQAVSQQQSQEL